MENSVAVTRFMATISLLGFSVGNLLAGDLKTGTVILIDAGLFYLINWAVWKTYQAYKEGQNGKTPSRWPDREE